MSFQLLRKLIIADFELFIERISRHLEKYPDPSSPYHREVQVSRDLLRIFSPGASTDAGYSLQLSTFLVEGKAKTIDLPDLNQKIQEHSAHYDQLLTQYAEMGSLRAYAATSQRTVQSLEVENNNLSNALTFFKSAPAQLQTIAEATLAASRQLEEVRAMTSKFASGAADAKSVVQTLSFGQAKH